MHKRLPTQLTKSYLHSLRIHIFFFFSYFFAYQPTHFLLVNRNIAQLTKTYLHSLQIHIFFFFSYIFAYQPTYFLLVNRIKYMYFNALQIHSLLFSYFHIHIFAYLPTYLLFISKQKYMYLHTLQIHSYFLLLSLYFCLLTYFSLVNRNICTYLLYKYINLFAILLILKETCYYSIFGL